MDQRALKRRTQQILRCSDFAMAPSICQCRRQTDRRNDSACGQYTWRWRRTARYPLLLFGLLTFPIVAAASIDYGSLTWSKWNEMYTSASDMTGIPGIYRSGPRVRAKILISTPISMTDLQTSTAWFRQQIKDFMEVETVDQVLLEYLQTEARSETEEGVYYVAVGISALPPPQTTANSESMLTAIEAERGRIAEILKYGKVSTAGNVTISSLWLFGKPMTLVDVVLDGESFTQMYLKPWLGLQLVIASVSSITTGRSGHYTMDRDAFQDLRLRFLLAKRLASLPVRVSDIIIHSPTEILPFTTYNADAGVLEIELHVNNLQYAEFVELYLHSDNHSSSSIAQEFNEMEPQWELLAMDIDTKAGELVYPSLGSNSDDRTNVNIPVLTFKMFNVSWTRLERSKGAVLDFIREALASVGTCRVRFGRIDFPSVQTNVATYNDGDDVEESIFDPVNAANWTLSFILEPEGTAIFDYLVLADRIGSTQDAVELGLQNVLGITDTSTSSLEFVGASNGFGSESTVDPFVSFVLTLQVAPSTILESPNFFQLHHIRSALVLLLQQVAVRSDQVTFVSADAVDRSSNEPERSWDRLLLAKYRVTISDESQRRGTRSIVFSHRLAVTISLYSGETLELIEREIDEGWPIWPRYLPGLFINAPELDSFSNGFVTSSTTLLKYKAAFIYDFNDPESSSASGLVVNSSDVCSVDGTASPGVCIKLRVTGSTQVAPIFLRKLQSLEPVSSSSIELPASGDRSSSSYPAPWITGQNANGEAWTLLVNSSSSDSNDQKLRLTFAAVYTMEDLSVTTPFTLDLELNALDTAATLLLSRPVGDLAAAATSEDPVPAFISAELPEVTSHGDESTTISLTLSLQEPRLGGLYSPSLFEADGTVCTECADLLTDCNSRLECREFSACASALFDDDLTLISTLIQGEIIKDVSWLLKDCLTPSDGTVWSSTMSKALVSGFTCFWQNYCPLVYDHSSNKQLVLEYGHGEQVLTFQLVAGHASLSFTLETTYELMEDFTTNATTISAQLDAMLTEMYRAAESNVATVKSTLTTTEEAATGVVTAHLTIQYLFLGRLPLPLVEITHSGSNDAASVEVTAPSESLHLFRYP